MYMTITAYDVLDSINVRVICTDEVAAPDGEAMHIGWKSSCTLPAPLERAWPDVVALVAEAVLDLAYERR